MSPYDPPHAVSQRHLVEKLHAAEVELSKKDNEDGQRDHIRGDSRSMRVVPGHHMIPSGRNIGESSTGTGASSIITAEPESSTGRERTSSTRPPADDDANANANANKAEKTPTPKSKTTRTRSRSRSQSKTKRPADMERKESKAKAFAFFGQDDSASDQSEEENPQ